MNFIEWGERGRLLLPPVDGLESDVIRLGGDVASEFFTL